MLFWKYFFLYGTGKKTLCLHGRAFLLSLFRSEETVAGVAEAGEDVSLVVETTV